MKNKESKALLEVWEWKDKAFKEVENMELRKALKERIKRSMMLLKKHGFKTVNLIKR